MPFDLSKYVTVAERIATFRELYPNGSLQSGILKEPSPDFPYIIVVAQAYRTPEDPRPGIGLAQECFPGKTPYTKDSETQNAETSAWGRAIVAVLAADVSRGVASAEEASGGDGLAGASATDGYGGDAGASGEGVTAPLRTYPDEETRTGKAYLAQLKQDVLDKYGSIPRAMETANTDKSFGELNMAELEALLK